MLCQNCGKNEVNFRYTQIINGVKKEMALCDKCATSLGLETLDFNMPINFSSFLGDFLGGPSDTSILPSFMQTQTIQCDNCGMSYEDFKESGKFGCSQCYGIFANRLNNVLKNIHGSDTHVGRKSRLAKVEKNKANSAKENGNVNVTGEERKVKLKEKQGKEENEEGKEKLDKTKESKEEKLNRLNAELKQAIKEERYEDAAKIRDELKKI